MAGRPPDDAPPRDGAAVPGDRPSTAGASTARPAPARRPGLTRVSWLLAAATFLAGLLLGTVTARQAGVGEEATGPPVPTAPAASPTPGASLPADTVTVPASCLEVADSAEQLAGLVREAAEAAGQLDASALSAIVRRMEESQVRLDAQSSDCRAGDAVP